MKPIGLKNSFTLALSFVLVVCSTSLICFIFLNSLDWVSSYFLSHVFLIYFLPLAGLIVGFFNHKYGSSLFSSHHIYDELAYHDRQISTRTPYYVLATTLWSHLFGASVGREGAAVQMGAGLADFIFRKASHLVDNMKFDRHFWREYLLRVGMSAGFAGVFGAPWAGFVFGLEIRKSHSTPDRMVFFLPCLVSAYATNFICHTFGAHHTPYPFVSLNIDVNSKTEIISLLLGLTFVLAVFATIYSTTLKFTHALFTKIKNHMTRGFVGGVALMIISIIASAPRYNGLGADLIHRLFMHTSAPSLTTWWDAPVKVFFTALSLASGFRGGEVVPLMFIGATAANQLAYSYFFSYASFATAIGTCALIGVVMEVPLTATVLTAELFHWSLAHHNYLEIIFSLICCISSYSLFKAVSVFLKKKIYV